MNANPNVLSVRLAEEGQVGSLAGIFKALWLIQLGECRNFLSDWRELSSGCEQDSVDVFEVLPNVNLNHHGDLLHLLWHKLSDGIANITSVNSFHETFDVAVLIA